MIDDGSLEAGSRLPSSRSLAQNLKISRTSVVAAYEELWSYGYIDTKKSAYSYIRDNRANPYFSVKDELLSDERITSSRIEFLRKEMSLYYNSSCIDMMSLFPDERTYPLKEMKKSYKTVLEKYGEKLFTYADKQGYMPLRTYLSQRLRTIGIKADAQDILITNGTQNSLDLIMRMFKKPQQRIAFESPTYANFLSLLKLHGYEYFEIPLKNKRFDYKTFKNEVLKNNNFSFIYLIPDFQNPTGLTMSKCERQDILQVCKENDIFIVEDAYEEEMKYLGKIPLPLKSYDSTGNVIYCGSFSKILFPGIRISWINAKKSIIEKLTYIKRLSDLSSNLINQAALYEFCKNGYYEKHINHMHRIYKKRMGFFIEYIKKYIQSEKIEIIVPEGGYTLWISIIKSSFSADYIYALFIKKGLLVSPGKIFFHNASDGISFRLSVARLNEEELEAAAKILSAVIEEVC
jgi:DNA-binding transcriptional MocR family regulator